MDKRELQALKRVLQKSDNLGNWRRFVKHFQFSNRRKNGSVGTTFRRIHDIHSENLGKTRVINSIIVILNQSCVQCCDFEFALYLILKKFHISFYM